MALKITISGNAGDATLTVGSIIQEALQNRGMKVEFDNTPDPRNFVDCIVNELYLRGETVTVETITVLETKEKS